MKKVKTMKKSMFFTTILMVVLLIVALSTATFAWFSANNTVTATQTTMTAATSTSASIEIGWDTGNMGSSISFDPVNMMQPAIPEEKPRRSAENVAAQYVVTRTSPSGDGFSAVDFFYAGEQASYVNVVETVKANTIAKDATLAGGGGILESGAIVEDSVKIAPFARLYKIKAADVAKYVSVGQSIADSSLYEQINANAKEYDFLIIDDNRAGTENFISAETAKASPYNISADAAIQQNMIYHLKAVADTYKVYAPTDTFPTTGNYIAGGVPVNGNVDYATFMTAAGVIDQKVGSEYYVHADDVDAFGVGLAREGDKVYCVTAAGATPSAITTDAAFVNSLKTALIDVSARFKSNGNSANYKPLNMLGETIGQDKEAFFIKNAGSATAKPVRISLTMDAKNEDFTPATDVRVAVFVKTENDNAYNYYGTMGAGDTRYGKILNGAYSTKDDLLSYTATAGLSDFITLSGQRFVEVKFVAWYEGTLLDTQNAGKKVNISFSFTAAEVGA